MKPKTTSLVLGILTFLSCIGHDLSQSDAALAPPDPCYDRYLASRREDVARFFDCLGFVADKDIIECGTFSFRFVRRQSDSSDALMQPDAFQESIPAFWECLYDRGALSDYYIALDLEPRELPDEKFWCHEQAGQKEEAALAQLAICRAGIEKALDDWNNFLDLIGRMSPGHGDSFGDASVPILKNVDSGGPSNQGE